MRDIDIRRVLLDRVRSEHADERDTLYLEELWICGGVSRADVAVVNGSLHCYEIKSERDTFARLPGQRIIYDRAFDFVTIVVSDSHLPRLLDSDLIPDWWGILSARMDCGALTLQRERTEMRNPDVEKLALAQFLWRDEVLLALEQMDLAKGNRSKSKAHLWSLLACSAELDALGHIVRAALKARQDWKADTLQA